MAQRVVNPSNGSAPRVAVVQDGARLHYAVPLALQKHGALERVFVEYYVKPNSPTSLAAWLAEKIRPGAGRRLRERFHPELDASKVTTKPWLAFRQARERKRFATAEEFYAWGSELVGSWIAREGFGQANSVFGFIRNISPTLCSQARAAGLAVVGDQMIAPMTEESTQARLQAERFPEWQKSADPCAVEVVEAIEQRSWTTLHHITCASEYVRDCLIANDVSPGKITVLPYPIEAGKYQFVDRRNRPGPVTVGFIGTVGLRKGSPYFVEVARRLAGSNIRFVLVGPLSVDRKLLEGVPNLEVVGPVARSEVGSWLAKFDLLLFPSTCEGSPGAVMEAMATGLPVVSTPNSGTVVRSDVEGFIHPYSDVDALAGSVERLASNAALRVEMGAAARRRAEAFNLASYSNGLIQVFQLVMSHR